MNTRSAAQRERRRRERAEALAREQRFRWFTIFAERVDAAWSDAFDLHPADAKLARLLHRQLVGRALRLMYADRFEDADLLLDLLPARTTKALLDKFFPEDDA